MKIGTRGSALALWQARYVMRKLRRRFPDVPLELVLIRTEGDRLPQKPLAQFGGRGVFTRELDAALRDRRIDLAVHSAKDYPTDVPTGLVVAAFPCRGVVHDALITSRGERLADLPHGALIGTGSLRRSAQLLRLRDDLRFAELRGNIETRLRKLDAGQYHAIVMAEAALRRLGIRRARQVLPVTQMVPDAGQGALMVVCRRADQAVCRMLETMDNPRVSQCVLVERAILAGLGGGCRLPLGVYAKIISGFMRIRIAVLSPDGRRCIVLVRDCPAAEGMRTARAIVRDLLRLGARKLLGQA
ncbi:MAG: hydroxymethylbilane synthase [Candidatus Sumerlaeia bacterium]|nr:hydroxymethylbilane synthase [Candidatus Sumerlaeia bacterium]